MSKKSALESSGVFKYSSVLKNKGALLVLEVQRSPAATRQESGFGGYEQAYRAQRDGSSPTSSQVAGIEPQLGQSNVEGDHWYHT